MIKLRGLQGCHFVFIESPYSLKCLTVMPQDHKLKNSERIMTYAYYINKIFDLLDTIFIVLKKNYHQVSVLHLVHHVYMAAGNYVLLRFYGYGGHVIVTGVLNLFVHAIMYGYYYLSSQSPQMKQNTWWKRYITIMQMIQFALIFMHSAWTFIQPSCLVPHAMIYVTLFMSTLMFVMFSNFYMHSYMLPKTKKTSENKLKS